MKTPYDTALRARRRHVDDLRRAIADAAGRLAAAEEHAAALQDTIARERRIAANHPVVMPVAYMTRARIEADRLAEMRRVASSELDTLRRSAVESYGSLRALEGAADTYCEEADRDASNAEQASVDDFAGARFAGAMHNRRRVLARLQRA